MNTSPRDSQWARGAAFWSRLSLGARAFIVGALSFALLQLWHPFFFLRDDNLTGGLGLLTTISRRIMSGESPLQNPYLFDGSYDMLRDPNCLFFFNPLTLLLAPLGASSWFMAIVDALAGFHLLVAMWATTRLFARLRALYSLPHGDNLLLFLSWSLCFSSYALMVGASWMVFLANAASWSLFCLGLFDESRRRGILWVAGATLYALLFGHLSPFFFTLLFTGIFATLFSLFERRSEVVTRFAGGVTLGIVLISPLLWQFARGFLNSPRSGALGVQSSSAFDLPFATLLASFFVGFAGEWATVLMGLHSWQIIAIPASCAAAWLVWGEKRARFAQLTSLEKTVLALILITTVFVVRPDWLGAILQSVPIFRSLRWPAREVMALLFFVHLWLLLRPTPLSKPGRFLILLGTFIFVGATWLAPRRSFADHDFDRAMLRAGRSQQFWAQVKPKLRPQDRLICIIEPPLMKEYPNLPFTMLAAYNYPALFAVKGASGYTAQGLPSGSKLPLAKHHSGAFTPEVGLELLRQQPHLRALHLKSLRPIRIDLVDSRSREALEIP